MKFISYELFVLFFYSQVLGLPGTLTGLAILLSMIVDAITDPVVGSWSDSIRSRLGRRHMPMLAAVLPVGFFFYLLFAPPAGLGQWGLFAWLTGISICLRTAFTFFAAPASAMAAEISPYPADRAEMGIYRQAISAVVQFVLLAFAFDLFFAASEQFPNGQENPDAYPGFGIAGAATLMFFMMVAFGGTWKHILRFEQRLGEAVREPFSFTRAIRGWIDAVGGSRNFRAIFFGLLVASTVGSCYRSLSLYFGTYLWELEPNQIKVWQQVVLVGMFTMAVAARFIVTRTEPKYVYLTGYCLLFSAYALPPALTLLGVLPAAGNPAARLHTVRIQRDGRRRRRPDHDLLADPVCRSRRRVFLRQRGFPHRHAVRPDHLRQQGRQRDRQADRRMADRCGRFPQSREHRCADAGDPVQPGPGGHHHHDRDGPGGLRDTADLPAVAGATPGNTGRYSAPQRAGMPTAEVSHPRCLCPVSSGPYGAVQRPARHRETPRYPGRPRRYPRHTGNDQDLDTCESLLARPSSSAP